MYTQVNKKITAGDLLGGIFSKRKAPFPGLCSAGCGGSGVYFGSLFILLFSLHILAAVSLYCRRSAARCFQCLRLPSLVLLAVPIVRAPPCGCPLQ